MNTDDLKYCDCVKYCDHDDIDLCDCRKYCDCFLSDDACNV